VSGTNYRRDPDAVHDRIQQRVHESADREVRAGVFCLCNHAESQHDDGGQGACRECNCRVFEWDPTI
jgi:hypothetical protein